MASQTIVTNTGHQDLDESKCSSQHDKDDKILAIYELDKRILSYYLHNYEENTKKRKFKITEEDHIEPISWMEFYLRIFYDKNNKNKTREKIFRLHFIINQPSKYRLNTNLNNNGGIYFTNAPKKYNEGLIYNSEDKVDTNTKDDDNKKSFVYEEELFEYENLFKTDKSKILFKNV